jgi:hypothetical protein
MMTSEPAAPYVSVKPRLVKEFETLVMQAIMDARHEGQQVGAIADVRDRPGQPVTAFPK